jgi:hypothetical protein
MMPPEPPPAPGPGAPPPPSAYAIASLVLGILGFLVLPIVGPVLAIVFAGMADREIAASGGAVGGKGFADAGRVLGIVGLALTLVLVALLVAAFVAFDWHVVRIERVRISDLHFPNIQITIRPG